MEGEGIAGGRSGSYEVTFERGSLPRRAPNCSGSRPLGATRTDIAGTAAAPAATRSWSSATPLAASTQQATPTDEPSQRPVERPGSRARGIDSRLSEAE